MPRRPRYPLPFAGGLDRATGVTVEEPSRFSDLRNLIPKEGKLEARRGYEEAVALELTSTEAATDIPFLAIFRSENVSIIVAYAFEGGADNFEVFYAASNGLNPQSVGIWGTLADAVPIPQVFGIDSFRNFFLAHDEQDITQRLVTVYADSTLTLTDLQANLDNTTAKDVLFRGVTRWGDYLLGWGFGTDSDKDRPEIVRVSLPGQPTEFRGNHYFVAGARSEAVLNCIPIGPQSVLVFKGTETYEILGSNATNWGIGIRDPRYGLAGSHLAVAVGGVCYFWSLEGPRVIRPGATGEESQDIGVPLDLDGEDPSDLVAEGLAAYGFAVYVPEDRIIEFNFPNRDAGKTRVYCLSVRDPEQPRWFYYEKQIAVACAGVLYEGASGSPVGYPELTAFSALGLVVTAAWDNVDAVGDETVEVWISVNAGAYIRYDQFPVSGASQGYVADGVDTAFPVTWAGGDDVSIALRYRRGIRYTDDVTAGVYLDPVIGGWDVTAIAQSVDTLTVDAVPPAPTNQVQDACEEEPVGSKTYMYVGIGWDNSISAASGRVTEVLVGTVNDADLAVVVTSVTVTGADDRVDHFGGWLINPTSPDRYVWVRHSDNDVVSEAMKVDGGGTHGAFRPSVGCVEP